MEIKNLQNREINAIIPAHSNAQMERYGDRSNIKTVIIYPLLEIVINNNKIRRDALYLFVNVCFVL